MLSYANMYIKSCNKAVFQKCQSKKHIRLFDVEEAMSVTRTMNPMEHRDYYVNRNIDLENVQKYYHVVKSFENRFNQCHSYSMPDMLKSLRYARACLLLLFHLIIS